MTLIRILFLAGIGIQVWEHNRKGSSDSEPVSVYLSDRPTTTSLGKFGRKQNDSDVRTELGKPWNKGKQHDGENFSQKVLWEWEGHSQLILLDFLGWEGTHFPFEWPIKRMVSGMGIPNSLWATIIYLHRIHYITMLLMEENRCDFGWITDAYE